MYADATGSAIAMIRKQITADAACLLIFLFFR